MTISAMATDQTSTVILDLSDRRPLGVRMGTTSSDLIGFLGKAPVIRQTAAGAVTGASDATALSAAITAVSLTLKNYGFTA